MTAYTVFGQAGGGALAADSAQYTMGMEFTVSQSCSLTGIWWNSPAGAAVLPSACCIYLVTGAGTGSQVSGTVNLAPSWSGAAGSGWVKCAYGGTVTLTPGNSYKVCVLNNSGNASQYGSTAHYWDAGPGSGGLTSGPLTAVNNAGGDGGQDTFVNPSGVLAYPPSSFNAGNYWVDVEVTVAGPAAMTVTAYSMRLS